MIVNGLVSLRTYERIPYFRQSFIDDLEKSTNVTFSYYGVNRWMGISLDMVCIFFSAFSSCFTIYAKGKIDNKTLAFALQILTDVLIWFSFSLRMAAEIENYWTSAQRIHAYT
jgi:hypothetical protein